MPFIQLETATAIARIGELFERGGPVLYVLAALSVAALTIVLAKLWQFARRRVGRRRFIEPVLAAWENDTRAEAVETLARHRGPVALVMLTAARGLLHGAVEPALLREEVERVAQAELIALRAGLRGLEIIAQIAPLLGLLGTVLGMIDAFQALQAAGSNVDPSALAGGIWTALLTTAAGLTIAIPAAAALYYLEGRVERERETMEVAATALFTGRGRGLVSTVRPLAGGDRVKRAS